MSDAKDDDQGPGEETPKATKGKEAPQVQIFRDVEIRKARKGNVTGPMAVFPTPTIMPQAGETIEIVTEGGTKYAGVVDDIVDVDGETCVTFDGGLKHAPA